MPSVIAEEFLAEVVYDDGRCPIRVVPCGHAMSPTCVRVGEDRLQQASGGPRTRGSAQPMRDISAATLASGLRGGQGIELGGLRLRVPAAQAANAGDREDRDARDNRPSSRSVKDVGGPEPVCERSNQDVPEGQ